MESMMESMMEEVDDVITVETFSELVQCRCYCDALLAFWQTQTRRPQAAS